MVRVDTSRISMNAGQGRSIFFIMYWLLPVHFRDALNLVFGRDY